MFKTLLSNSNFAASVFTRIREKKNKKKTAKMMSSETINLFQSFSNLHHSVLIFLSNSDNFNIVLSEFVNLVNLNSSYSSNSDSSCQSDSKYHSDSNTSISSAHISMTEKVSHNTELFETHFRMMNNNNNNVNQSYQSINFTY